MIEKEYGAEKAKQAKYNTQSLLLIMQMLCYLSSVEPDVKENELPMWVADMDFETAPAIIDALHTDLGKLVSLLRTNSLRYRSMMWVLDTVLLYESIKLHRLQLLRVQLIRQVIQKDHTSVRLIGLFIGTMFSMIMVRLYITSMVFPRK